MFNVCPGCGVYAVEKGIDPAGPFAVCPACGYRHRFLRLPLFVITGAGGAGKSTVCLRLPASLPECVVLETDILWGLVPASPDDNYRGYHNAWLRLAKNVGQSGRPVVLCGTALPDQLEDCPERRYFAAVHYLCLVCDDAVLRDRLRSRPGWRASGTPPFVEKMSRFNAWLRDHAGATRPPMTLLDTSAAAIDHTVEQVAGWVRARLPREQS